MDQDEGLWILASEIIDYLQSHQEDQLEQIELRMASYLAAYQPSVALLVWNAVNRDPEAFGLGLQEQFGLREQTT